MQMYSGILGPLIGPLGPMYVRKLANGDLIIVPRYRTDKKSPAQLEYRRRLSIMAKIASKIYLFCLKPFKNLYPHESVLIAEFCKLNMQSMFAIPNWWQFRILPVNVPPDSLCSFERDFISGGINMVVPYVFAEDVLPGDLIYCVVLYGLDPSIFMIKVNYVGGEMLIPCPGLNVPSRALVFYSAFSVRSAGGGLVSVVHRSNGGVQIA